jgi:uncharacterized coiled-coil protein SlyX
LKNNLKKRIHEIETLLNDPKTLYSNTFQEVRNKLIEERKMINEINLLSNSMLEKLDNFENECIEKTRNLNNFDQIKTTA